MQLLQSGLRRVHGSNDHVQKCRLLVGDFIAEFVHLAGEGRAVLRHSAGIEVHPAPALSVAQVLRLAAEVFVARAAEVATTAGDEGVDPDTMVDVPKERWVSFPHCEGEDGTLVIAWAGYDHLQLARAVAERYELAKEQEGRQLVPLLAAIGQLIPWLKQWHNEMDPAFGTRMGDFFEGYLAEEAKALGQSVDQVMAWAPPEKPKKAGRKKK
jgi:hypothetical protein